MKIKHGSKAESNKIVRMVTKAFMLNVFAEEQPPQETNTQQQEQNPQEGDNKSNQTQTQAKPVINYEDLITKARHEEKVKQQGKIEKLTNENKTLVEKNNDLMLKVGQLEAEKATLEKDIKKAKEGGAKIESEEIKSLNGEIEKLNKQIEDMKKNTVNVEDIENSLREEYELKIFKMEKIHEAGNQLIPELVMGTTKDEILASIEKSKERYNEIVGNVNPNANNNAQQQSGGATSNVPTGNINTDGYAMGNLNPDQIRDMSTEDWAEYRRKLGLR